MTNGKIKYYYTEQNNPISDKLKNLTHQLTPEDNPVIMLVKLR